MDLTGKWTFFPATPSKTFEATLNENGTVTIDGGENAAWSATDAPDGSGATISLAIAQDSFLTLYTGFVAQYSSIQAMHGSYVQVGGTSPQSGTWNAVRA